MPKDRGYYVTVYVALPDDEDFGHLSRDARDVFMFGLKCARENNIAGILQVFREQIAERSKVPLASVQDALHELEAGRWIVRDGRWVWIRNHLRWDPSFKPRNKNHLKRLVSVLEGLPRSGLVHSFIRYYQALTLNDGRTPFLPADAILLRWAPWVAKLPPANTPTAQLRLAHAREDTKEDTIEETTRPRGEKIPKTDPDAVSVAGAVAVAVTNPRSAHARAVPTRSRRAAGNDEAAAFADAVLELYRKLPGTRAPGKKDRETVIALARTGVPFEIVRAGLVTAIARRELRTRDEPLSPITSFAYFADVIREMQETPPDQGYVEHLLHKLGPRLKGQEVSDGEVPPR